MVSTSAPSRCPIHGKVDCVVYAWEKQGGLSCDWSHVSGADKEPAR